MSAGRITTALPALRSRNFRLLFGGQAVSVIGDALFPVALAFAVLDDLDGTPAQLGNGGKCDPSRDRCGE